MIYDSTKNLSRYSDFPYLNEILDFLKKSNLQELPTGDIAIKEDLLYVKVLRYIPNNADRNFFETHQYYADLQLIVNGTEAIYIVDNKHLIETDEFKMTGDFTFYKAETNVSEFVLEQGQFAVFFPGEAHKPGCTYNSVQQEVLKLVFKIKMH